METQDDSRLHFLTYLCRYFFHRVRALRVRRLIMMKSKEASDNFQKDKAEFYQRNFLCRTRLRRGVSVSRPSGSRHG